MNSIENKYQMGIILIDWNNYYKGVTRDLYNFIITKSRIIPNVTNYILRHLGLIILVWLN